MRRVWGICVLWDVSFLLWDKWCSDSRRAAGNGFFKNGVWAHVWYGVLEHLHVHG